jgi:hypothetical protein
MGVSRPESEADNLPASAAKNRIQGVPTHRRIKVKALGTVIIVGPLRINSCIVYSYSWPLSVCSACFDSILLRYYNSLAIVPPPKGEAALPSLFTPEHVSVLLTNAGVRVFLCPSGICTTMNNFLIQLEISKDVYFYKRVCYSLLA